MAATSQSATDTQGAKEQVQEKAQQAAGEAKSRLHDQVDERSTQVGEQVSSSAQALRSTAERLREEGQDGPAKAAEQLAGHAEKVGSYLSESDADRILDDVEEFARRQPLAVVGIGLFAGFAASRFLKASSRSRYERRGEIGYAPSQRIPSSATPRGYAGAGVEAAPSYPPPVPSGTR